ncbi:MAG: EAL domain-containing protein [Deltaproteobacteria bacterium]|nr:EAL domain-containing protein [Deltaproteobacteria bacterium]
MPSSAARWDVTLDDLRGALARGELVFYFQPKVSMVLGTLCGAEALIRWRRGDGSIVPPAAFIPLAESSGFITEITLGMLDELVADLAILHAVDRGLVVSFNASARDFEERRLVDSLVRLLDGGLLPAGGVEVELTESAVLAAGPPLVERLDVLRKRGVSLAMDDFGTGYSSIDTLSRLPFTTLKVDQGIVGRMQESAKDATIVESSIRLAHCLGLDIVAEGIETEAVFLRLQAAGCSVGQGFWMGRPMPLDDLVALLRSGRRWPAGAIGLVHMAMLDHLEWRKALVDALLSAEPGGNPPPPDAFSRFDIEPTECRLGRWYKGPAKELAGIAAFAELEEPHDALHACGKRIVSASLRGVRFHDLVSEMRDLTRHSTRIIGLLQELEHAVLERLADGERARSGQQREARASAAAAPR